MVIGLILDDETAKVAVRKGKRGIKGVKRYELSDLAVQDGVLKNPHMLGKELLLAVKKDRIKPTELLLSIQCKDLVVTEVAVPVVSKKLLPQTIRLALQKSFPGVLENNYFAYKIYNIQDNQYQVMIAMLPKEIAQSYYQLSYSMKCKLKRMDIQSNVLVKSLKLHYGLQYPNQHLIVDLHRTALRLYYVEKGIIQISNSSTWRSGLGSSEITNETLQGLCRKIEAILSTVSSGHMIDIYLYDSQLLTEENISYLAGYFEDEFASKLYTFTELFPDTADQLMKALMWEEKLWSGDLNFVSELDISDSRNFTPLEAGLGVVVGLSITALAGSGTYGYYQQKQNEETQAVIALNQAFIEDNKGVDELYTEELSLSKEVAYVDAVDRYAELVHYDFSSLEADIEEAVSQNGGQLAGLSVDTNLNLVLNGQTDRYGQIADMMQMLKKETEIPVDLNSVARNQSREAEDTQEFLDFVLTGSYNLAAAVQETEKGNSEDETVGNQ